MTNRKKNNNGTAKRDLSGGREQGKREKEKEKKKKKKKTNKGGSQWEREVLWKIFDRKELEKN